MLLHLKTRQNQWTDDTMKKLYFIYVINNCSNRGMEVKLPALLGYYDRPTDKRTDMRSQREVTLSLSFETILEPRYCSNLILIYFFKGIIFISD